MNNQKLLVGVIITGVGLALMTFSDCQRRATSTAAPETSTASAEKAPVPLSQNENLTPTPETGAPDLLSELTRLLPEPADGKPKVVMLNGQTVVKVDAGRVEENAETGVIKVHNLKRVDLMDGSYIELTPQGTMTYDPAKNTLETASEGDTHFVPMLRPSGPTSNPSTP